MTARESFEVATRFFFGDTKARLKLVDAEVTRRFDMFGRDEIFFGVSIKPRRVDFDLFHQGKDAENCYGPFRDKRLRDPDGDLAFPWAGPDRLIWEGWLDRGQRGGSPDLVLRADIYVGERDVFGIGFSDNVVFRKQVYVRALLDPLGKEPLHLELHTNENFQGDKDQAPGGTRMDEVSGGWQFDVEGDDFRARFRIELEEVSDSPPEIA
jgi:hypothetical protein